MSVEEWLDRWAEPVGRAVLGLLLGTWHLWLILLLLGLAHLRGG